MLTKKEMDTKVCGKCKEVKTLDGFSKDKSKKDGYQSNCKACVKEYDAEYRADNSEKVKESSAEYRATNPHKGRAKTSTYRAAKRRAIPPWLTKDDYKLMDAIYEKADRLTCETGIKHEVDHIIPLQPPKVAMFEGKMIPLICAFQCPANLQILTKSQNCAKSNKFTPYVESELS